MSQLTVLRDKVMQLITDRTAVVDKSAADHNTLVGHVQAMNHFISMIDALLSSESVNLAEKVVESVVPGSAIVIDGITEAVHLADVAGEAVNNELTPSTPVA